MEEHELDRKMRRRAELQHGLVTRDWLRELPVSRQVVAHRLASPDWDAVTRRVLRLAGMPVIGEQRALAAVLDAGGGAVVSHRAAAALWGLAGFELERVEVSRPRGAGHRSSVLAVVHHPRLLPGHHRTERHGVPVTTLARTVVDLAAGEHPHRVEAVLNAALRKGMSWEEYERTFADLERRGRHGIPVARALLAEHSGEAPLGSGLEGRVLRALAGAGLPRPRRQVDLGGPAWVGRVDFYFDDARLVVEVDGDWTHSTPVDVRNDRRRDEALIAAGFRVLRIPESTVRGAPGEVVRLVADARRACLLRTGL